MYDQSHSLRTRVQEYHEIHDDFDSVQHWFYNSDRLANGEYAWKEKKTQKEKTLSEFDKFFNQSIFFKGVSFLDQCFSPNMRRC
jgi:hypothetical protein